MTVYKKYGYTIQKREVKVK